MDPLLSALSSLVKAPIAIAQVIAGLVLGVVFYHLWRRFRSGRGVQAISPMTLQIVQICVSLFGAFVGVASAFMINLYSQQIKEWLDPKLPGLASAIIQSWLVLLVAAGEAVIIARRQRIRQYIGRVLAGLQKIRQYWPMTIGKVSRYPRLFMEKVRDLTRRLIPIIRAIPQALQIVAAFITIITAIITLLFRSVDLGVTLEALAGLKQQKTNLNLTATVIEDDRFRIQATLATVSGMQTAVAQTATAMPGENAAQRQPTQTAIAATQIALAQTATIVEENATQVHVAQAAIFATQTALAQKIDSYAATLTATAKVTPPRPSKQTPGPPLFTPTATPVPPTVTPVPPKPATTEKPKPTATEGLPTQAPPPTEYLPTPAPPPTEYLPTLVPPPTEYLPTLAPMPTQ